jgi:hypothetical protein
VPLEGEEDDGARLLEASGPAHNREVLAVVLVPEAEAAVPDWVAEKN